MKGEASIAIVFVVLVIFVILVFTTTVLNNSSKKIESEASSCSFDSGANIPLGSTETDASNMENRWPISQYPHEYDILGPGYFSLRQNSSEDILNLTHQDGGAVDSKVNGFMGSMFGYKPNRLVGAYDVAYGGSVPRGNDTEVKGNAPVLEVPTRAGETLVKVPNTGYSIGGGYEAMVVFAAEDRITIHIGRHEYFVGSGGKNCNGNSCSGGYWIYVKGICVDQKILTAYNSVKSAQQSAGADKNPIQLPMVLPGQALGKAQNNSVTVGVRDNGPFISTSKPIYWQGVEEKNISDIQGQGSSAPTPTTKIYPTDIPTPIVLTNTPVPRRTNTPVPVSPGRPTNTPVPRTTNTPVPRRTNTPRPNPSIGAANSPTPNIPRREVSFTTIEEIQTQGEVLRTADGQVALSF